MSRTLVERLLLTVWLILVAIPLVSQSDPVASKLVAIGEISAPAGLIFSGTVLRVERALAESGETATVRVRFRVDKALRGCVAGQTIVVTEWAGIWAKGDRYREGQRLFLFLYPPSEAGLTSTVAGDLGKYEVGSQGLLRLSPQQVRFLASRSNASSQSGARPTLGESNNRKPRARLRSDANGKTRILNEASE